MREITTTVDIAAPPGRVWETLMDFDTYREWNPFVVSITGRPAVGSRLVVRIALPRKRPTTLRPTVTEVKDEAVFEWFGSTGFKGVFDGRHRFELALSDAGTRFVHSERFTGILAGLVFRMIGDQTRSGFDAMNAALKDRAET
jgi:hypothetical protein